VREIGGQWADRSGKLALDYMLDHVRCHVAVGPRYRAECKHCQPRLRLPGYEDSDAYLARKYTSPGVLEQLRRRIARARDVDAGMIFRLDRLAREVA
jgi:hypothetical protein